MLKHTMRHEQIGTLKEKQRVMIAIVRSLCVCVASSGAARSGAILSRYRSRQGDPGRNGAHYEVGAERRTLIAHRGKMHMTISAWYCYVSR